jgi:RNA polymerase sigma-70 factor (ECF subfamily)
MTSAKFNIIIPPQDIQQNPECLSRIAAGDANAFAWLYKNYCSKIYDYALLLTADKHLSDDIVQEVFLKVWAQKEKLIALTNFNSWLYITTKNLIVDHWRKQQYEKEHRKQIRYKLETETSTPFKNEQTVFTHAVNSLTEKQQLIYKLIREEGRSRQEISEALNISPNTIRNTMQNALHNIKSFVLENKEL